MNSIKKLLEVSKISKDNTRVGVFFKKMLQALDLQLYQKRNSTGVFFYFLRMSFFTRNEVFMKNRVVPKVANLYKMIFTELHFLVFKIKEFLQFTYLGK